MSKVKTGDVERRFVPNAGNIQLRNDGDGEATGIGGLGIPVGVSADIGPFTEEISRAAVTDAISQDWDVRGLFNHDPNMVLGRTKSGTMSLKSTRDGLEYDIPEMPATRSDVLEAIKREDVDGNSFSFTVESEEWDESSERDKPHRTIKRFGQLFDVGPVTFPAYEGQTVVSARSMEHIRSMEMSGDCGCKDKRGDSLGAAINSALDAMGDDAPTHEELGSAAGISASTVGQIVGGNINCPPIARLEGLADALNVSLSSLITAAERDGCDYERDRQIQRLERRVKVLEGLV